MEEVHIQRRLVAILAADVVGYSRLMGDDEAGTRTRFNAHLHELIEPAIGRHRGRTVKTTGDGLLVEFASVVEAVQCAVDIQKGMVDRNADESVDRRIRFRIGVNLGDVIIEGDDIHGDGVNVAARLEALADPDGVVVSGTVHEHVRGKLDFGFDDLGLQEAKNIAEPVRAYRVVPEGQQGVAPTQQKVPYRRRMPVIAAAVLVVVAAGALAWWQYGFQRGEPHLADTSSLPSADNPSIAVLPFNNMSGDKEQEYFSDGMTEDLITDLSHVSGLLVIARNSVFTYKGRAVKVQQVGRELGVQYVLEGSVRKIGNRVRINAQLVDASNGHHLWADRFDREITDVFALQDEVVKRIVAQLAVKLTKGEQERLSRTTRVNPEAYDVLLRGLERFRRFTRETNVEARAYFQRAAAIDPLYTRAHADVALTYAIDVEFRWTESPGESIQAALEHVQAAPGTDKSNPYLNFALAMIYMVQRRYDDAIAAGQNLTRHYPNYADGFAHLAQTLTWAGKPQESLLAIRKAMRINPRHGLFYVWMVGHNYFLMERYEAAIAELRKVVELDPGFPSAHLVLASAYGLTGQIENAEWEAYEFIVIQPNFSLAHERQRILYKNPEHRDRYIEGLRKAGLPE